jgi:hypothetical protein
MIHGQQRRRPRRRQNDGGVEAGFGLSKVPPMTMEIVSDGERGLDRGDKVE